MAEPQTSSTLTLTTSEPPLLDSERAIIVGDEPIALVIEDGEQHELVCQELQTIKAGKVRVEKEIDKIKRPLNDARNALLAMERRAVGRFQRWIDMYERAIIEWRKAERERVALIDAERQREAEREAIARREAQEQALAEAAAKAAPQQRAVIEQLAAEVKATPIIAEPLAPVRTVAKNAGGLSETSRWHAECYDLAALVGAIAGGKADLALVQFDQAEGNRQATALKQLLALPGVKAVEDTGLRKSTR